MDQAQRDRMAAMSGDQDRGKFPAYVVPEIRFDGNTGEFRKIVKNDKKEATETPLPATLRVVTLKKRNALRSFADSESWYSTEYSSPQSTITLFHSIAGTTEVLMRGTAPEIRAKYPHVKTQQILYVLYEGEVCKIAARGGSAAAYYDFQKKMQEEDKHSFEYTLVVTGVQKTGPAPLKKKYFAMSFSNDALDVDVNLVEEKMNEVDTAIRAIDEYEGKMRGGTQTVRSDEDGWTAEAKAEADAEQPGDIPF